LLAIAAREWFSKVRVTEEECRAALAACLVKGWLQVIDERAPTPGRPLRWKAPGLGPGIVRLVATPRPAAALESPRPWETAEKTGAAESAGKGLQ
jgi:hypothetical protein